MTKRYIYILASLLVIIICGVTVLIVKEWAENLSICEGRFDNIALDEFDEVNQVNASKIVVDFHDAETKIEVTDPDKIKFAMNFMYGRNNNWKEPCLVPGGDIIGLYFYNESGELLGHYGFWSNVIVYYPSRIKSPSGLPPILLYKIEHKEREDLFEELAIPNNSINKRLGLDEIN
jgi:hypothetical protein